MKFLPYRPKTTCHQSNQTLDNLNMQVNAPNAQNYPLLMQMAQSQPRGQMLIMDVKLLISKT